MHVIHLSFECYPVAKAGGLGDVVGALPKYQQLSGVNAWVVMPRFHNKWVLLHQVEVVHRGETVLGRERLTFEIHRVADADLGFPLFLVHIPGLLDRPGVYIDPESGYGYWDEFNRFLAFQLSALNWIRSFSKFPDIIHCHDHHAALVPLLLSGSFDYSGMEHIPTVLTIHNGEYHGNYDMSKTFYLPTLKPNQIGFLEWGGRMNSLSSGIRKAWAVTTVSESYLEELQDSAGGLEYLLRQESGKSYGIINGIDDEVWNPSTDPLINHHYSLKTVKKGKRANKEELCEYFNLDPEKPLFAFIGRLVKEKGADLLPDLINWVLSERDDVSFVILGTGDPWLHDRIKGLNQQFSGFFDSSIQYNEALSHKIYAGADFIMMPSRVEPCGLNQMYAMRYGTIPIVRSIGGLKDTVIDFESPGGYGVRFDHFNLDDAHHAIMRAMKLYEDKMLFRKTRAAIMKLNFSWNRSAEAYNRIYQTLHTK